MFPPKANVRTSIGPTVFPRQGLPGLRQMPAHGSAGRATSPGQQPSSLTGRSWLHTIPISLASHAVNVAQSAVAIYPAHTGYFLTTHPSAFVDRLSPYRRRRRCWRRDCRCRRRGRLGLVRLRRRRRLPPVLGRRRRRRRNWQHTDRVLRWRQLPGKWDKRLPAPTGAARAVAEMRPVRSPAALDTIREETEQVHQDPGCRRIGKGAGKGTAKAPAVELAGCRQP